MADTLTYPQHDVVTSTSYSEDNEVDYASEDYLDGVVEKYKKDGRKMDVLEMRKNVRIFTCVLFFPGKYHPMRKSRGLWKEPIPDGWPKEVPYCDPNNTIPDYLQNRTRPYNKPKEGSRAANGTDRRFTNRGKGGKGMDETKKKSKPGKPLLKKQIDALIKIFDEQKANETLLLPDDALSHPTQPADEMEDGRYGHVHEQGFINPGEQIKAITDPMEVSGGDSEMKKRQVSKITEDLVKSTEEDKLLNSVDDLVEITVKRSKEKEEQLKKQIYEQYGKPLQMKQEPPSPANSLQPIDTSSMNIQMRRPMTTQPQQPQDEMEMIKALQMKETAPLQVSDQYVEGTMIAEEVPQELVIDEMFTESDYQRLDSLLPPQQQDVNELFPTVMLPTEEVGQGANEQPTYADMQPMQLQGMSSLQAPAPPPPPPQAAPVATAQSLPANYGACVRREVLTLPVPNAVTHVQQPAPPPNHSNQVATQEITQIVVTGEDQVVRLPNGNLLRIVHKTAPKVEIKEEDLGQQPGMRTSRRAPQSACVGGSAGQMMMTGNSTMHLSGGQMVQQAPADDQLRYGVPTEYFSPAPAPPVQQPPQQPLNPPGIRYPVQESACDLLEVGMETEVGAIPLTVTDYVDMDIQ